MTIILSGDQSTEFRRSDLTEDVDARDAIFHQRQASNGDYPFNVEGAASGLQFLGGDVLGGVPTGDWQTLYSGPNGNSAAVRVEDCPDAVIDGWTFRDDPALGGEQFVWDGIRTVGSTDNYTIQNILMHGCRDDALELENGSGGIIRDSRFFDCFVFMATDGDDASGETMTIDNTLISMGLHSYKGRMTHQSPFKANKDGGNPEFEITDSVIAIRDVRHEGYERLEEAFAGMTAENSYYLNLSNTPLPKSYPDIPQGFTVLQGQAARDFWADASGEPSPALPKDDFLFL